MKSELHIAAESFYRVTEELMSTDEEMSPVQFAEAMHRYYIVKEKLEDELGIFAKA